MSSLLSLTDSLWQVIHLLKFIPLLHVLTENYKVVTELFLEAAKQGGFQTHHPFAYSYN